jgi:hypothetical protein
MTDAILISANPSMVEMDDALRHFNTHPELYWSVGVRINKAKFTFPIYAFIHISGHGRVEYRALVRDIIPFSPNHYEMPTVKPEEWRNDPGRPIHNWRNSLVMTELVPFSLETGRFNKPDGERVLHAPEGYIRVVPPNEPANTSTSDVARTNPSPVAIYEKNLEDLVIQQLEQIEPSSLVFR